METEIAEPEEVMEKQQIQVNKAEIRKMMGFHSIKDKIPEYLKKSVRQKEYTQSDELGEIYVGG